jgi:hypothetical protein
MVPLPPEDAELLEDALEPPEEAFLSLELEPQAARAIAATTPSTASEALVLRMR